MTPPLCVFGFAETALVNQAPAKSAPGLGPSGFDPHAFARPGLRAPLTSGLRAVLQDDLPDLPRSQVAHHHRSVADRPNGLSAAWPCLQRAFAAYPRPGEAGPAVFHGPIARGLALDSPGLPRPTDADEQTTSGSAFQIEGVCCARFADG